MYWLKTFGTCYAKLSTIEQRGILPKNLPLLVIPAPPTQMENRERRTETFEAPLGGLHRSAPAKVAGVDQSSCPSRRVTRYTS